MKIKIIYKDSCINKNKHSFINDFIKFVQEQYPLKEDITIIFLPKRVGTMTTGSRTSKSEIKILGKNRMMRDILRTLAHEWVHEYQMSVLNREMGPNIGGQNEDEANSIAAKLLKIFEKNNPIKEYMMYE